MNKPVPDYNTLLTDALQELRKMRSQLEANENAKTEPIAIIGMDCRFPGGASNPESYWNLLEKGVDGIQEIPSDRWNVEKYYDDDPDQPGKMYTRHGGFLNQVDQFDPRFFGISPLEAVSLDPQQRLLLEVSYGAIENAGYPPESLKGSKTGVFVGICFDDYAKVCFSNGNLDKIEAFSSLGNSKSVGVGRLSYIFGFQGPALGLDTSCSSSLLAIHLACQSLRNRESNLALAGGVNLMLAPDVTIGFCKLRALSAIGRCKTFDAMADGYVRGEGCGIVVLKRLSDALADGDRILALIRGSAANHDGRSNGLTAPNGLAQEAVIKQALSHAKVQPTQIQYLEAHGTGTTLGDPIEVMALSRALGTGRTKENPLFIGSVKTNFGHLEGAAGVAALMKVVLSIQHQQIPPHLHFSTPNPYIPWQQLPLVVPTQLTPWTVQDNSRLAGVSSFGMSGTNVHLIVEEAPIAAPSQALSPQNLLVLSAKTPSALEQSTANLAQYLQQHPQVNLTDVAYTLSGGRQAYPYRRKLVCSSREQAIQQLQDLNAQSLFNHVPEAREKPVIFLFSGQGSQYVNMGLELYQNEPIFREEVDRCTQLLQPLLGIDLRTILYPQIDSPDATVVLQQTVIAQSALFVIEYALAKLWMSWGVTPQGMLGHSLGEYVAACLSGVFSVEDALWLVVVRGKLMQQLPKGKMLAVVLPQAEVLALINQSKWQNCLTLAVVNSPSQCVVSGETEAIDQLQNYCLTQGIVCRLLNTSHAFHSQMMEPILKPFIEQLGKVQLNTPQIPYLSNVTGTWITSEQAREPNYWVKHLRQTVRFADGLQELLKQPENILLEVGPSQVLTKLVKQQQATSSTICLASLTQTRPGSTPSREFLFNTLGQLWLAGVIIDWQGVYARQQRQRLTLPSYPFQRQRYWIDTPPEPLIEEKQPSQSVKPLVLESAAASRPKIERLLRETLEESLGINPISLDDNFFELGGDSLLAIELVSRLSQTFQVKLNSSQLIETPTIAKLAVIIEKAYQKKGSVGSCLVQLQGGETKRPIFFIHPASGTAFCYQNFLAYWDDDQPIYALEDPYLKQDSRFGSFQEKAQYYVNLIRQVQPEGPYLLAGYSYGGNMALEMAIHLQKQGQTVDFLGLLDSFPPVSYKNIAIDDTRLLAAVWQMTSLIFEKQSRQWFEELQSVEPEQQIDYVVKQLLDDKTGIPLSETVLDERTLQVAMNNFRELHHYIPSEIYSGQITYFWAAEKIPESLSTLLNYQIPNDLVGDGWGKLTSLPIKNYYVPGHHFTMLNSTNFPVLAQTFLVGLRADS